MPDAGCRRRRSRHPEVLSGQGYAFREYCDPHRSVRHEDELAPWMSLQGWLHVLYSFYRDGEELPTPRFRNGEYYLFATSSFRSTIIMPAKGPLSNST